jgi:hypothetical protein
MPKHGAEYRVGGELGVPGAARIYGEIYWSEIKRVH